MVGCTGDREPVGRTVRIPGRPRHVRPALPYETELRDRDFAPIAYADRARGERRRPTTGWDSLTPTEVNVVRLVAAGLTNKEVGRELLMGAETVKTHLTHVYDKLGIRSRAALATELARRS